MKKQYISLILAVLMFLNIGYSQNEADNQWVSIDGGTMSNAQLPFNFTNATSVVQVIYSADLIGKDECVMEGLKYFYTNNSANIENKNVKVYICPTTLTNLSGGWIPQANFTLVFDGQVSLPMNGVGSELDINFDTPYQYTGGNICIMTVRSMDNNITANVTGLNRVPTENTARFFQSQSEEFNFTQAGSSAARIPNTKIKIAGKPATEDQWISIEGGTMSNAQLPFNFTNATSVVQVIYSADLIGMDECKIKGLKYFYTNNTAAIENKNAKVYIAPTTLTNLSGGWIPQANFTLVFDGQISLPKDGANSELDINFTSPYIYTGGNICIMTVREMDVNTTANVTGFNRTPAENTARFFQSQFEEFNFTQAGTAVSRIPNTRLKVEVQQKPSEFTVVITQPQNGSIEVKNGDVIINNGDIVNSGTTLTFNAIPNDGYHIVNKYINGAIYTDESFELTKSVTLSAEFAINKYSVSWSEIDNGTISVKNGQLSISNGAEVNHNTVLTITANVNTGYDLQSLTVNDQPFTNGATYTVTEDVIINTVIKIKTYPITWTNPKGATITVSDGENNIQNGAHVDHFKVITISANVSEGYNLDKVSINGMEIENNDNITVTTDITITVNTSLIDYTLTYNNCNGAVNSNPLTYNIEQDDFNLLPLSLSGYNFEGWYDNADFTGNPVTKITAGSTGNKIFYAKWSLIEYSITYYFTDGGLNENPLTYNVETETINLLPVEREGLNFEGWFDNESFSGNSISEIIKGSTGNKNLYAKWEIKKYTITASAGTHGSITPKGIVSVEHGEDITFLFEADEDFEIEQILVDGKEITINSMYTFENVSQNHSIEVNFRPTDGVESLKNNDVKVYSYNKTINFESNDTNIYIYNMIDITGKVIKSGSFVGKDLINVENEGMFIVNILFENKIILSKKIVL